MSASADIPANSVKCLDVRYVVDWSIAMKALSVAFVKKAIFYVEDIKIYQAHFSMQLIRDIEQLI